MKKSGGRVFQTDTAELVAPDSGDAEWADFMNAHGSTIYLRIRGTDR